MSVKILICFLCVATGSACGYFVLIGHRRNFMYADGLCGAIQTLLRNMAYRRDSAARALSSFACSSPALQKNIAEYVSYAEGKSEKLNLSRGGIAVELFAKAGEFLSAIGGDGNSYLSVLSAFNAECEKLRDEYEKKYKKFGPVAVKLGFLFGLGVGVLVL